MDSTAQTDPEPLRGSFRRLSQGLRGRHQRVRSPRRPVSTPTCTSSPACICVMSIHSLHSSQTIGPSALLIFCERWFSPRAKVWTTREWRAFEVVSNWPNSHSMVSNCRIESRSVEDGGRRRYQRQRGVPSGRNLCFNGDEVEPWTGVARRFAIPLRRPGGQQEAQVLGELSVLESHHVMYPTWWPDHSGRCLFWCQKTLNRVSHRVGIKRSDSQDR